MWQQQHRRARRSGLAKEEIMASRLDVAVPHSLCMHVDHPMRFAVGKKSRQPGVPDE